jgi:hypothetical protein
MRVVRDHVVGDWHALDDFDALTGQRIVFHVAHGNEAVDSLEPSQCTTSGINCWKRASCTPATHSVRSNTGLRHRAFLTLAGVVDQKLRDLAERAAFLAIVDDDAEPAVLACAQRIPRCRG